MSIGEALARARREADLTVPDISRRTRIRETIVSGIEQDDFSLCGGDFYARGHIRAIARMIGIDPEPLVEEYDAVHLPPDTIPGIHRPPDTDPAAHWPPETLPGGHRPIETIPGHEADEPAGAAATHRQRRVNWSAVNRVNWSAVIGLALLAVLGVGGYLLASGGHTQRETSAAANHRASTHASAHPTPRRATPSPTPTHSTAPVQALSPVNIAAFGPGGTGEGDNPQLAPFALDDNAATPWHSDWYTTPQFGNLQPGTGLLLAMGRTVTVTAAQIAVGDVTGADIELRVGDTPALADLPPVAHGTDVGGTVRLDLAAPSRGRYVLVWFTKLPQDQAGAFQASAYSIKLQGST